MSIYYSSASQACFIRCNYSLGPHFLTRNGTVMAKYLLLDLDCYTQKILENISEISAEQENETRSATF